MNSLNIFIRAGVGLFAVFVFILWSFRTKENPDLVTIIVIFWGGVGLVVGSELGYTLLTTPPQQLGILDGRQIQLFVGALAIFWVSLRGIIKTFTTTGSNADGRRA